MERREFFKLAGASAAVLAVGAALYGCDESSPLIKTTETEGTESVVGYPAIAFVEEVDVLIVGSGIAGLSAAMDPIEAGLSVMVADKRDLLGGESYDANGLFYVSGADIQKKAGITKTAEDAWKERKAELEEEGKTDNLSFKQNLLMAQPEWIDRVVNDYKAQFADPKTIVSEGAPDHVLVPKNGLGDMDSVMTPIKTTLSEKGVVFKPGMHAAAFILDAQGKPCGMRFHTSEDQKAYDVKARRIIFATGGFTCNQEMVNANLPAQAKVGCYTVYSDGKGMKICQTIGGQTVELDKAAPLTSDLPQVGAWGLFGPTVNVDPMGNRFAREDQTGASATTCATEGLGFWWTVYDAQLASSSQSRAIAIVTNKNTDRIVGPFDTLDELAGAMKTSADTLKETFEDYNRAVDANKDERIGRESQLKALTGPYYAIKQFPARYRTLGGMQTDDNCQLMGLTGPIDHVYCCGSAAAGSTNGLMSCAAYGMIAGKAVVASIESEAPQE